VNRALQMIGTPYAWAPYQALEHFAASQYRSGTLHPDPAQLRAGDLISGT
jgi:hypothetical protein